jgi:hypothetical protein
MKKVAVSLFLACILVFGVSASTPPMDTSATAISPNLTDAGDWSASSDTESTIDTSTGFVIMNPDSSVAEIKAHVKTAKSHDPIYPWVSIDAELDSGYNFVGVTAIRITYKADKPWYIAIYDPTLDPDNSGSYQAVMPAESVFTTHYYNVSDTSTKYDSSVTFSQPSWVETKYRSPINFSHINGFSFSPNDDAGDGVETTVEISDLRLFNYAGYATIPVRYFLKNSNNVLIGINLARSNVLSFSVPQNNTYTVSIYSPQGKLVARISKSCSKEVRNEIALKNYNLVPGLYMVKVSQTDYFATGKIMIK